MNKKWQGIVLVASIAINLAVVITFGFLWAADQTKKSPYSEKELKEWKKMVWIVKIMLDTLDSKTPAIQYAAFDYNPIPNFRENVKSDASIYNEIMAGTQNDERKSGLRRAAIRINWDKEFENIGGDKVYLITRGSVNTISSNGTPSKLWLVTKLVYENDEPFCWSIPVEPEIGKEVTVNLAKATKYDVVKEFDQALTEGNREFKTNYPLDPNFKDEPVAHTLYNRMIDTFQKARSIYYESAYWFGRENAAPNQVIYKVWLKKPNYARIETTVKGHVTGTLVGDGDYFWIYWGDKKITFKGDDFEAYDNKTYMQIPAPQGHHSLAHAASNLKAGISMLPFEPSQFHGVVNSLNEYLDGVRSAGTEDVQGEQCDRIEVSYMKNQRSLFLWISRTDFLPRKILEVVRVNFTVLTREIWSNVFVDMGIPDALFQWHPPVGWIQYHKPEWEKTNLIEPGAVAPDFKLKTTDGGTMKLSQFRGKVILLNFWRIGCQPCREELPILESIYQRYKDQGFTVIGINICDIKKLIIDLLRENSVTYPNIIDTTPIAQDLYFKQYQKPSGYSAVPMNYLIDREGKVADAWYGFDKDDDTLYINKLKLLGIK
jgi:peroxiredoxin/outer membrane lipoprotein-sorting protein